MDPSACVSSRLYGFRLEGLPEGFSQQAIARHAAYQQYGMRLQYGLCFSSLAHKRIYNRPLIAGYEVHDYVWNFPAGTAGLDPRLLNMTQRSRFESAETEIQASVADFRYGKREATGISVF